MEVEESQILETQKSEVGARWSVLPLAGLLVHGVLVRYDSCQVESKHPVQ